MDVLDVVLPIDDARVEGELGLVCLRQAVPHREQVVEAVEASTDEQSSTAPSPAASEALVDDRVQQLLDQAALDSRSAE